MGEFLLLKWGTIEGWEDLSDKSKEIMRRYFAEGVPLSCGHPDKTRQAILCELIDQLNGEIHNYWTGKVMTKEEAKKYVVDYRSAA